MQRALLSAVSLLGAVALTGCLTAQERVLRRLGPAAEITTASMKNLGWGRLGDEIEEVSFTAIVTTWDAAGRSYTDRQEMTADLADGEIVATGGTPQGAWTARAGAEGDFRLKADRGVDREEVARRMEPVLATLLHRLRGPYNLLVTDERARTAETTRVDGQAVVRVGVGGDNRRAVAYYFDATLGVLKFVTAGADTPGADGTVTLYEYDSLPNGVLFPRRVRVVRLGRHVLIGEEPVMQVELSDVRFEKS